MLHLKNIEVYIPDEIPESLKDHHVTFFRAEDGTDFYKILSDMKEDTVKVLYVGEVVVGFSTDASSLYPAGASLIELRAENVPEDVSIDGRFMVDLKKRCVKLNDKAILENAKLVALEEMKPILEDLQDRVDTGKATDEVQAALTAWKSYRIAVREATKLEELPEKP